MTVTTNKLFFVFFAIENFLVRPEWDCLLKPLLTGTKFKSALS